MSRLTIKTLSPGASPIEIGIATRALPAEADAPCGDIGLARQHAGLYLIGLIDGLGHGVRAHDAASQARDAIEQTAGGEDLAEIFTLLDRTFRGGRGFVAALCRADVASASLEFCGIGNITTRLFSGGETTLLSGQGIVGQHSARPRLRSLPFPPGSFLVLHTDGMSSHLHAEHLLAYRHQPALLAARRLLELYARPNDDCGVVVMRRNK